ncbi:Olfactory receptor 14J1-like protein [Aix galericulata]|nr:Olfactory receptor 14J1-like protein [Aix galericulata]
MSNSSSVTKFLLLTFSDTWELQLLHFALFLGIYLVALLGNGLILSAVACDHCLHTPMYFFLLNLALLDLGSISTTLPKTMTNSLWDTRAISYQGCVVQVFLSVFLIAAEFYVLTIMAYDRYLAICKPLHYGSLLGSRACAQMAAAAWGSGFLNAVLHIASTFSLPLCHGNAVGQYFCEIPHIFKLSCSDAYLREVGFIAFSFSLGLGCFVFIVLSSLQIFRAVLRIPLQQGLHKAFSTCLPHLAVVSLFVSTVVFAGVKPPTTSSLYLDFAVAVLYLVVPPAVNPLIYSMRNQELKHALKKLFHSDPYLREVGVLAFSVCLAFGCFVFIALSYVQVVRAVLRMPSEQGQHKAFSTCLPHLAVVSLHSITAMVAYLKLPSTTSVFLGLAVSVLYSVLPPASVPKSSPSPLYKVKEIKDEKSMY